MFDHNYDAKNGVDIWGHVLDGAATGALGGAAFAGVGAIPGAIGGGLVGLANGLWESHDESVAEDTWMAARHDDATVDRAVHELEGIAMDPSSAGMSDDEALRLAGQRVFRQDRAVQEKNTSSWFDDLF